MNSPGASWQPEGDACGTIQSVAQRDRLQGLDFLGAWKGLDKLELDMNDLKMLVYELDTTS